MTIYSFLRERLVGYGKRNIIRIIARLGLRTSCYVEKPEKLEEFIIYLKKIIGSDEFRIRNYLVKIESIKASRYLLGYKAVRFKNNMPVRGQRTHTNSKTRRHHNIF